MNFNPLVLMPVYLPILLGYIARKTGTFPEEYAPVIRQFCLKITIPLLVFTQMATLDTHLLTQILPLALALPFWMLLLWGAGMLLTALPRFSSRRVETVLVIVLGNIAYIGWAVCDIALGEPGLVRSIMFAVLLWPVTIFLALLTQLVVSSSEDRQKAAFRTIKTGLPLLAAFGLGLGLSLTDIALPDFLMDTLSVFGHMTTPIILFGAGLSVSFKLKDVRMIPVLIIRLILGLGAALLTVTLFRSLDEMSRTVILMVSLMPVGVNALIVGEMLELDEGWIAGAITLSTLAALITIPLQISSRLIMP